MKKSIQTLLALTAFGAAALFASAQPAPKILVVDLGKLFDTHYKTQEQSTKLRDDQAKAQTELDRLNKEGNGLVEHYKELADQANSPVATAEAKGKAQAEGQKVLEEIRAKQTEVQTFQQDTRAKLQQRMKAFHDVMLAEISATAVDIAKRKGCNLLIDKSGQTLNGVAALIYSDPDFDITADVQKEINKDRPASAVPSAMAPDTGSSTPASDSPNITLPGARKP
ncbi:MAG: OmpH family outer membrane protein [Opitutaceae bacterium]